MNIDELKKSIQAHFTDGLVTIVGSGLSAGYSLPTMGQLAQHLLNEVPKKFDITTCGHWKAIDERLNDQVGIEVALRDLAADNPLIPVITDLVADLIEQKELEVITSALSGDIRLAFRDLVPHLTFSNDRHFVITTNYDRLIELSIEQANVAIGTLFDGKVFGRLDKKACRSSMNIAVAAKTKVGVQLVSRKHVVVLKPHGSLDWYEGKEHPVRCPIKLPLRRLMIAPGGQKYRKGYESPFDIHRADANEAIDKATRYLVIGYGFNDDHLETHLRAEIGKGKPCLVLVRGLTDNIKDLLSKNKSLTVLSHAEEETVPGTLLSQNGVHSFFAGINLWSLDSFIKEVLT
ncbi:SIR2 family protein [Bdellovibrio sp. HCB337]|uniref:SIR2 family protein n=1 Tax=Bdellovibrio sp. HCB337 TaxID=3394358 RepID=UPI0039A5EBF2